MRERLDEKAMKQYTEMLIDQLQQMKESNWEKPWFCSGSSNFVTPQNINGRPYSGGNVVMLMFDQQIHNYQLPVYMTFQQAANMGLAINKGEKSFPITYWNHIIKDENGRKISDNEYDNLSTEKQQKCKIIPFQNFFNVFNVQQTNIKTSKPELWEALLNKLQPQTRELDDSNMMKQPALDKMLEDNSWLCKIMLRPNFDQAYYDSKIDAITLPEKKQFIDGESFYTTLLHEMIHSTGSEERLNRLSKTYSDLTEYAREELVAELGSAMTAIGLGITKTVSKENQAYLKNWLEAMKEDPKFLMTILSDTAKAVDMVHKNLPQIEVAEVLEEEENKEVQESQTENLSQDNEGEIQENEEAQESQQENVSQEKEEEEIHENKEKAVDNTNEDVWSNVRTVEDKVVDDLIEGKITLHEAAVQLNRAGLVNYVPDGKETLKLLNVDLENLTHSRGSENEQPMKINTPALMAAIGVKVDVSLRDFAVNLPMTDRRIAIGLTSLLLSSQSQKQLTETLEAENYDHGQENVDALWQLKQAFQEKVLSLNEMVVIIEESIQKAKEREQETHKEESQAETVTETKEEIQPEQPTPEAEESRLERFQKILDDTLKGKYVDKDNLLNLLGSMPDEELKDAQVLSGKRKGRSNMVKINMGSIRQVVKQEIHTREADRLPELAGQKAYENTIKTFSAQTREQLANFDFDSYIKNRIREAELYEDKGHPGLAAEQRGIIRAALEMKDQYGLQASQGAQLLKAFDELKSTYNNGIILIRQGNKYHALKEDAEKLAEVTGITVDSLLVIKDDTKIEVPDARFPSGELDNYLPMLVKSGIRVAICDSMDTPLIKKNKLDESQENKEVQEIPSIKFFHMGNGICISEGDNKETVAWISQNREVKLYKEFHPDNLQKIREMAETGNMIVTTDATMEHNRAYLVLDPVNPPSKIYENSKTMDRVTLHVETVDGQRLATYGRTIFFFDAEKIDQLMDYTPENMAKLEKKADELIAQRAAELKEAFRKEDQLAIEQATISYMWAERYKHQSEYNPIQCKERIDKIEASIKPLNVKIMDNSENKEKQLKDGVHVFKMQNGQYGIYETKNGERSKTRRIHEEDLKAYFDGLKGQPIEEVNRRREILADKYLRGNAEAKLVEQAPRKTLAPLEPEVKNRLSESRVFRMQDGVNYGVRTKIDGEQYSTRRVSREDISAFFDGYKDLTKEKQLERIAQLAGMYFKEELNAPKQEHSQGMHR